MEPLIMRLDGTQQSRSEFLSSIRAQVIGLTHEAMTLDAVINEIAKNVYDHAGGLGTLELRPCGDGFAFEIRDGGTAAYDFNACVGHSTKVGNGVNRGAGLQMITDLAEHFDMHLQIDTTRGFAYQGVYAPRKR